MRVALRTSFFLSVFASASFVWAGAAVTYQGRILDPNGRGVESQTAFKIQVRSPGTANCLLYEETRTVDMHASDGIFVIPIGDGQGLRTSQDPGITIENVFSNNTSLTFPGLSCNSGNSYQPAALDSRKLLVSFDDGSGAGAQALPPMDINQVPFSLFAQEAESSSKIGAVPASRVMSVATGAAAPLSAANFAELLLLVNGNSNAYVKTASLPSCSAGQVLKSSGGAIVCVTDDTGTDTLAGISCVDGKILKRAAGAWTCGDESGVGTETDPTVQAYAKRAPGAGLAVNGSNDLVADFGTGAGKVVQGNDSRMSDARAPNGAATGDLDGSYPNPTVKGLRGNAVAATSPTGGQLYKWNSGTIQWEPGFVSFGDLKKSDGTAQMPSTCAANETLAWSAITDVFSCAEISSLDAAKITSGTVAYARLPVGTAANTVAAGDDARFGNALKVVGTNVTISSLSSGQVLKYDGANWVNAPDVGVGSETDPTVQAFAKNAPATGLIVNGSSKIAPDFGTGAGKIVEGNDARLSDNRVASDLNGVASAGLVQRTGPGAFSTLGVSAPITNSGTNIGLAVGSGLTLSGGNLVPDFGAASGKVAQGNDARFPSSTCGSGNKMRWDGSAWQCETDASTDSTKVAKSGDTMTGALALPSDGLAVGTSQLVVSGGNVGVGTDSPGAGLDVAAQAALVRGSAANAGEIRLGPGPTTGSNYVGFRGPASNPASNVVWRLPAADGTNGQVLATDGTGGLSWATASGGGGGSWSVLSKNSSYTITGSDGNKIFTVSGTTLLTLPEAATAGSGFQVQVLNAGTGVVGVVPAGGEQINGYVGITLQAQNAQTILTSTGTSWYASSYSGSVIFGCGPKTYYTSGSDYSFVVPAGCTSMAVKAWGAGGGSGGFANYTGGAGGGGGFASSSLSTTSLETLTLKAGGPGGPGQASAYNTTVPGGTGGASGATAGNGANGGTGYYYGTSGGGGGGGSFIYRGSTILLAAGGGGGGSGIYYNGGPNGGTGGSGGAAGTTVNSAAGGASGASGTSNGLTGANASGAYSGGGGGGGGGYLGGGGGAMVSGRAGGGGGGSNFGTSVLSGSGATPGGSADPDYSFPTGTGAGIGGSGSAGAILIVGSTTGTAPAMAMCGALTHGSLNRVATTGCNWTGNWYAPTITAACNAAYSCSMQQCVNGSWVTLQTWSGVGGCY